MPMTILGGQIQRPKSGMARELVLKSLRKKNVRMTYCIIFRHCLSEEGGLGAEY